MDFAEWDGAAPGRVCGMRISRALAVGADWNICLCTRGVIVIGGCHTFPCFRSTKAFFASLDCAAFVEELAKAVLSSAGHEKKKKKSERVTALGHPFDSCFSPSVYRLVQSRLGESVRACDDLKVDILNPLTHERDFASYTLLKISAHTFGANESTTCDCRVSVSRHTMYYLFLPLFPAYLGHVCACGREIPKDEGEAWTDSTNAIQNRGVVVKMYPETRSVAMSISIRSNCASERPPKAISCVSRRPVRFFARLAFWTRNSVS